MKIVINYLFIALSIILLMPINSVLASDLEDIENYLNVIAKGHIEYREYEKQLSDYISEIEEKIKNDQENPYLWYLKGRSSYAALRIYGVVYGKSDGRYDELRNQVPMEYEKALSLNKIYKSLNESQLSGIYSRGFTHSVSVEAARQYMDLKKQKGRLYKKEHLRLLRERVVPGLIKQNKFEEAYQEMDYIDQHFPENAQGETGNIAWRQHFEQEIAQQKRNQ